MKVLVKRVGESPKELDIDSNNTLSAMQKIVGGYIEPVSINNHIDVICNEEGKICGLNPNAYLYTDEDGVLDCLCGDIVFTRYNDDGDYESLTYDDIKALKDMLNTHIVYTCGCLPAIELEE